MPRSWVVAYSLGIWSILLFAFDLATPENNTARSTMSLLPIGLAFLTFVALVFASIKASQNHDPDALQDFIDTQKAKQDAANAELKQAFKPKSKPTPPPPPVHVTNNTPPPQTIEQPNSLSTKTNTPVADGSLWLRYTDGKNQTTDRLIRVQSFDEDDGYYFDAYDVFSGRDKTFRVDRVQSLGYSKGSKEIMGEYSIKKALKQSELLSNDDKYRIEYFADSGNFSDLIVEVLELKQAKKGHWYIVVADYDGANLNYRIDNIHKVDTGREVFTTPEEFMELFSLYQT